MNGKRKSKMARNSKEKKKKMGSRLELLLPMSHNFFRIIMLPCLYLWHDTWVNSEENIDRQSHCIRHEIAGRVIITGTGTIKNCCINRTVYHFPPASTLHKIYVWADQ